MNNKVVSFPKVKAPPKTTSEVSLNDLSTADILSFLKVARALRDIGYSKNATVRILEEDIFIEVEYHSEVDESQHYTDSGAMYKKTSAMDLLPLDHPDNLADTDAVNAVKEMFANLDIKQDIPQ